MTTEQVLLKTFASNFVAYYKSHAAHINVVGRNFYSDHQLLNTIYDNLQDEIDTLGELLRTIDVEMPETISDTVELSDVIDSGCSDLGDGIGYLTEVYDDLETLIEVHLELEQVTQDELEFNHLANYAQDRVKQLHKFCWMIKSTLAKRTGKDLD